MSASTHGIDRYLFEKHWDAFVDFVERKSGMPFESFADNPYIRSEEGFKLQVSKAGNEALDCSSWKRSSFGTGQILRAVLRAIEIHANKLVPWSPRHGEKKLPHLPFLDALNHEEPCRQVEVCLFRLYRESRHREAFESLFEIVENYRLIAYLLFLKDHTRFLPIAPRAFEESFRSLGIDFSASKCSWANYQVYNDILLGLRDLLSEHLDCEVQPLDAHSFAWIIARQMKSEEALPDVRDYVKLGPTERDAMVKARVGQGRFRDELIQHWETCAVTGVGNPDLLRTSHIIPWSKASIQDRANPFNGLLLAAHIDALFEAGLISFADSGSIIISPALSEADADALGVHKGMSLRSVDGRHMAPLEYHRSQRFRASWPESQR